MAYNGDFRPVLRGLCQQFGFQFVCIGEQADTVASSSSTLGVFLVVDKTNLAHVDERLPAVNRRPKPAPASGRKNRP